MADKRCYHRNIVMNRGPLKKKVCMDCGATREEKSAMKWSHWKKPGQKKTKRKSNAGEYHIEVFKNTDIGGWQWCITCQNGIQITFSKPVARKSCVTVAERFGEAMGLEVKYVEMRK